MKTDNPFQSPKSETFPAERRHPPRLLGLIGWSYPVLLVASLYGTWLVAWLSLGHMPRPSIDDPKHIGTAVDVSYLLAGLLFVGFPAAAVIGVALQLSATHRPFPVRLTFGLFLVGVWVVVIALLRWDPISVGEWFMD